MSYFLSKLFETLFLPPGIFIVLLILSVLLLKSIKYLKMLLVMQILLIYMLSTSFLSDVLFSKLEMIPALSEAQISVNKVDAIVVLAGGISRYKKEYHGPDIGYFTGLRLRYGAWLQKRTGLPMVVTGGIEEGDMTEAELMKQVLQNEYDITSAIWVEKQSKNTFENARYSSKILHQQGYSNYYLVTSAFHMPRALDAFRKYNDNVIPAPMGFFHNQMPFDFRTLKPSGRAIWDNYLALHEMIGRYWYQVYYD